MKKLSYLLGFFILLVTSCSESEVPVAPAENLNLSMTHVTMQEARNRLSRILPKISVNTRAGFAIGQGLPLNKEQQPTTRSADEDVWYYYFPIDGGTHFAIMSAKPEFPQLLAYGDGTPSFDTPSGVIPEPDRWDIEAAVDLPITLDSGVVIEPTDTSIHIIRGEPIFPTLGTEPTDLCPVKWDQNYPFSMYCPEIPDKPGEHANACCVALAAAQLFASEKCLPKGSDDFPIYWDMLLMCPDIESLTHNPQSIHHLAEFLLELGKKENLDVTYSYLLENPYVSVAFPYNLPRTLTNFGFRNGGNINKFDDYSVIEELHRGYPVITNGKGHDRVGHTWLIHGMMTTTTPVFVYRGNELLATYDEINVYFQCNWGCRGQGDGFFLSSGFNPQTDRIYNPENQPPCPWPMGDLNYSKTILYGVTK